MSFKFIKIPNKILSKDSGWKKKTKSSPQASSYGIDFALIYIRVATPTSASTSASASTPTSSAGTSATCSSSTSSTRKY